MIDLINLWFKKAVPSPTAKNQAVQLGVHFEEIEEMLDTIDAGNINALEQLNRLAEYYKHSDDSVVVKDRQLLLDSLCDQIVTAVGVAHMFGLDITGALEEVNRSNWSKFVDGEPVFNKHGKIAKGPNYSPPDLSKFV